MLIALLRLDHDRRPLDTYLGANKYKIAGDILMLWNRAEAQGMTNTVRLKPTQLHRLCVDPDVGTTALPTSVSHTHTVYLFGDSTTILRSMNKANKTCGDVTDEWRTYYKDGNAPRIVDMTEGGATLTKIVATMKRWRATKAAQPETDDHLRAAGRAHIMLPGEHVVVIWSGNAYQGETHIKKPGLQNDPAMISTITSLAMLCREFEQSLVVLVRHHQDLYGMPLAFDSHLSDVRAALDSVGIPATSGRKMALALSGHHARGGKALWHASCSMESQETLLLRALHHCRPPAPAVRSDVFAPYRGPQH